MTLNRDYVGRRFGAPDPYVVSRAKVQEFAAAVGDPDPAYRSVGSARSAGRDEVAVPPTFAIVVSADTGDNPIFEPAFGMRYDRVVHGEQRFVHHRPMRVGDELVVESEIAEIREAGANEIVRIDTRITAVSGEAVCTATNTLVSRGTAGEVAS